MSDLRVELLYTLECPHFERVRADLHRILSEGAIEVPIQLVLVGTPEDAEFLDFRGSPTVRVNGTDVVPPSDGAPVSLECRTYAQEDGRPSWIVPEAAMREAVNAVRRGQLETFRRGEAKMAAAAALEADRDEREGSAEPPDAGTGDGRARRSTSGEPGGRRAVQ